MRVYPLLPSTGSPSRTRYFWMVYRPGGTFSNQVGTNIFGGGRVDTVQDFLIKLGIKPRMHLLEISIFSLNNDIVTLTKIMNNLVKGLKILSFKVIFQCLKLVESFPQKISVKNIWLGDQLLSMKFFENFDF